MAKYVTEFVGTMFLVLIIGCSVAFAGDFAPIAIGVGLMALVYMGGHVSGAHYNPAVTLGALMTKKIGAKDAVAYMVVQVIGATVGAFAAAHLTGKTFAPGPGLEAGIPMVLLAEVLFTFMLVLVVLNVATVKKVEGNSYYGLAIGLTVTAGAYAVGKVSGAAFNPAVGIGPTVSHVVISHGGFGHLWLYLVGPFLGAGAASGVFLIQQKQSTPAP